MIERKEMDQALTKMGFSTEGHGPWLQRRPKHAPLTRIELLVVPSRIPGKEKIWVQGIFYRNNKAISNLITEFERVEAVGEFVGCLESFITELTYEQ